MRELFVVGCKLLGLFFLYCAFTSLLGSIGLIASIAGTHSSSLGSSTSEMFLLTTFSIIASIVFAFSLIFKTDWLADKLKLTGRLQDPPGRPGSIELQPGIILIGIYIFCTNFERLPHVIALNLRANNMASTFAATQPNGLTFSLELIAPVMTLILSMLLIFCSGNVAAFLERRTMVNAGQINQGNVE